MKSFLQFIKEQITKADLDVLEKYLDKLYQHIGIDVEFTKHFLDRVNDERNKREITLQELVTLFKEAYSQKGKKIASMKPGAEAVLRDMETDINVPFVLKYNAKDKVLDLVTKTIMRKPGFKSSTPFINVD